MSVIIDDIKQGEPEWFTLKAGVPSAGSFDKIITTKGELSKQRPKYLYQLAGESITGRKEVSYQNQNMLNGTERETTSRMIFAMLHEVEIQEVGFVFYDERRDRGASPDGLIVGRKEGFEMKNPLMSTHISYLLGGRLPTDYFLQTHGSLYITGYDAWWFSSFYLDLPPFILRVEPDEKIIAMISPALDDFCGELADVITRIKKIGRP